MRMLWARRRHWKNWHGFCYYCREGWRDLRWRWRNLICQRLVIPLSHWLCGSHTPVFKVMRHLDDLEASAMYGNICYDSLPNHVPVEDRIHIAITMLNYVRTYIAYNYMPEEMQNITEYEPFWRKK